MGGVRGTTWFGSAEAVDMTGPWLGRKLGDDASAPKYLTTVRGVGLRFETDS